MSYTERLARLLHMLIKGFIVIVVLGFVRLAVFALIIGGARDGQQRHVADEIESIQRAHPDMPDQMTTEQLVRLRRNYR